jgi:diphosphomevalonate decarboxylase
LTGRATAVAHANIALIKYWGKADDELIVPRASSLSLTLDGLETTTTVRFGGQGHDTLALDGRARTGEPLRRVSRFLDLVRAAAGIDEPAEVVTRNGGPTAAGLASSASGFAALALAASAAAGLDLSPRDLSRLARRGSGSASRSVFGGLAVWHAGHDDQTSYAEPVDSPLDLAILVIEVDAGPKAISSRDAMRRTVETSPLYDAWVRQSAADLRQSLVALRSGDLETAGAVFEANALGMHATMIAARPGILYWAAGTVTALHAVQAARAAGLPAWATIDAGPNVKVIVPGPRAVEVAGWLRERLSGVPVSLNRPGPGAALVATGGDR